MTTFALVHGGWGSGWHWASVPRRLRELGHDVVAPDLPCDDPEATFEDYATAVLDALSGRGEDVVVVGFSLGGIPAGIVAGRRPVSALVYVGAILPEPGWSLTQQFRAGSLMFNDYLAGVEGPDGRGLTHWVDFDVYWRVGCHDCSEEVARERFDRSRAQATRPYFDPFPFDEQPEVPTRYLMCADDRMLDNRFWRPAVRERLGIEPLEIPGSHAPMAARPEELMPLLVP